VQKLWAALGSLIFLAVAPGTVAGLVPWWLTGWTVGQTPAQLAPLRNVGAVLVLVGAAAALHWWPRLRPWHPDQIA
jgi:hypothetical protein